MGVRSLRNDNGYHTPVYFLALLLAADVSITAGPPFVTDDPEPVGYRHWEIYFASQLSNENKAIFGSAPSVEANYGLLPEVQISAMAQLSVNSVVHDNLDYGPGDLTYGVKYRFLKESVIWPQSSIYPAAVLPTGDSWKGLGVGKAQIFLPLWLQKSFGPWTTYGGGGYQASIEQPSENFWLFGWEGQRDLSNALTLGAELFAVTEQKGYSGTEIGFNVGAIVNLSPLRHILASAGRDIAGLNQCTGYLCYQLTL